IADRRSVGDDELCRLPPNRPRPALDEANNRVEHRWRGAEISLVNTNFLSAEADHDAGVFRQCAAIDACESARLERDEQLVGAARSRLEPKIELRGVRGNSPAPNPVLYRLKHLTGPATKFT